MSASKTARPVLLGQLLFPHFIQGLAVYAQRRRGARLEPLQAYFDAAAFAIAVVLAFDLGDRLLDFLDQFSFAVAIAQLERHIGLLAGAVVGVGKYRGFVLHGVDGAIDILRQLDLERFQDIAEMRELLLVHVLFALFRGIGREGLMA